MGGGPMLAMPRWSGLLRRVSGPTWSATVLVTLASAVVLWLIVQPLARHTNDPDSSAVVLHFQRLAAGDALEAFVPTTPKPLLTILYGLAWNLTGDWRALVVLAVLAGAGCAGLAARLAGRLAGPPAAAVAVIGLLAWPAFQGEVVRANSFVWALALWLLAAVLMTEERPRPWGAGIALALAALSRPETVWLLAAVTVVAGLAVWRAARGGGRSELRLTLPLLLGWAAIPVTLAHDALLTGDPLYSFGVPVGYTILTFPSLGPESPLAQLHRLLIHYRPALGLVVMAVVGGIELLRRRRGAIVFAMACLVGGVLASMVILAWRGVYTSARYYEEADAPLLLAAAVGGAALVRLVLEHGWRVWTARVVRGTPSGARPGLVLQTAVAAVLALGIFVVAVPRGSLDRSLAQQAEGYAALERVRPQVEAILSEPDGPSGSTMHVAGIRYPVADPATCRMFVPRWLISTIAVEAGVPVTTLGDSTLAFRDADYSELRAGQWVLHIAAVDGEGGVFAPFEISEPGAIGDLSVVPVLADPEAGVWIVRLEALQPD